jgi:hypothetical protein
MALRLAALIDNSETGGDVIGGLPTPCVETSTSQTKPDNPNAQLATLTEES